MPVTPFSAEHDALRASVSRFVADRLAPHVEDWDAAGEVPDGPRQEWARTGLAAVHLPTAVGGDGGDVLDALVVAEELGRCGSRSIAESLLDIAHGAAAVLARSPGDAARDLAVGALAGDTVVALALDGAVSIEGGELTGDVRGVRSLRGADHVVVRALGPDGASLHVVALGGQAEGDGWRVTPSGPPMGLRTLGVADLELRAARSDPVAGEAERLLEEAAPPRLLACAAAAVAAAWAVWEATRAYALEREAFGRPIGRFQVNRHHLADAAARLTAARQVVRDAAWSSRNGTHLPLSTAAARYADRTCAEVSDQCLQLHGGYGYSMELPVQRAWRDDVAALRGAATRPDHPATAP